MQNNRRTFLRHLSAAGVAGLSGSLLANAVAASPLRISTSWSNDPKYSTARIWYDHFMPMLKQESGGQVNALFFPDSQLGQEADTMGQMKLGVVDVMINGSSIWSNIVSEFSIFDLGYIIRDYDHLQKVRKSSVTSELEDKLMKKQGVSIPSWLRPAGARHILTKKSFNDPATLKGQKVRTIPNRAVTKTIELMGATATPLAFGETYTALQAGVLDGVEHDAPTILTSKFYETAKSLTLTRHLIQPIIVTLSARGMQRFKLEQREAILRAIQKTENVVNEQFAKTETDALAQLKDKGIRVQPCDTAAFSTLVKPLWTSFTKDVPGALPLFDTIQKARAA